MSAHHSPNLFIIGAAKCATSSLHTYLGAHPEIFMSYLKEPGYFIEQDEPQDHLRQFVEPGGVQWRYYRNDLKSYLGLFADAGNAKFIGESSTGYTQLPARLGASRLIYESNPRSRLIYVIRDPVERTISHYWWQVQHEGEERDILSAIVNDSFYRDTSYYAMQLEPYLDLFPRDQVLCLTMEELRARPETVLRDIFFWLGVDPNFVPGNVRKRENVTAPVVVQPKHNVFSAMRGSRLWNAVGSFTPRGLRALGRRVAERRIDTKAVDTSAVVDYLRPIQLRQTEELRRLLGRDFPEWRSLYRHAPAEPAMSWVI